MIRIILGLLLAVLPMTELAARMVTIDARDPPFSNLVNVQGMNIEYSVQERTGALTSLRGQYNIINPPTDCPW